MTVAQLERDYRLKPRLDECGDQIIPGRHGHLYVDAGKLCLQAVDGKPRNKSRWQDLGGKLWMGDISKNEKGLRVQDVEVIGVEITPVKIRLAIKLLGIKPKRIMSDAQKAVLDRARSLLPSSASASPQPESDGDDRE